MSEASEKYQPLTAFTVRVPICGYVEVSVEANDEQEAVQKAFEVAGNIKSEVPDQVNEFNWETFTQITRGNVFCGMLNEIEVTEQ